MLKIFSTLLLCLLLADFAQAQDKPAQPQAVNWTIGGQITLSSDFKENIFLNFAGPGVKLSDKSKKSPWAVSINMFPSLRYNTAEKDGNKVVTPILGVGFQVFYKKLVVSMPCYYLNAQNIWVGTLGLGYSF
jgi:hypothetical protein